MVWYGICWSIHTTIKWTMRKWISPLRLHQIAAAMFRQLRCENASVSFRHDDLWSWCIGCAQGHPRRKGGSDIRVAWLGGIGVKTVGPTTFWENESHVGNTSTEAIVWFLHRWLLGCCGEPAWIVDVGQVSHWSKQFHHRKWAGPAINCKNMSKLPFESLQLLTCSMLVWMVCLYFWWRNNYHSRRRLDVKTSGSCAKLRSQSQLPLCILWIYLWWIPRYKFDIFPGSLT